MAYIRNGCGPFLFYGCGGCMWALKSRSSGSFVQPTGSEWGMGSVNTAWVCQHKDTFMPYIQQDYDKSMERCDVHSPNEYEEWLQRYPTIEAWILKWWAFVPVKKSEVWVEDV